MGHTIVEWASSTSVLMTTACVEVSKLGIFTVTSIGAGLVSKTAVEHGSLIMTLKIAVAVFPFTVAVRISGYVLWFALVAPFI